MSFGAGIEDVTLCLSVFILLHRLRRKKVMTYIDVKINMWLNPSIFTCNDTKMNQNLWDNFSCVHGAIICCFYFCFQQLEWIMLWQEIKLSELWDPTWRSNAIKILKKIPENCIPKFSSLHFMSTSSKVRRRRKRERYQEKRIKSLKTP